MSEPQWHPNTMLGGVVGSTVYGLAGPGSDRDYLGVYAAPFAELASLHPPLGRREGSLVSKDPDCTQHEALKYATLALSCNPTVLELMWLPEYEVRSDWLGGGLVDMRAEFLSQRHVRNAYLGYATQQFNRLEVRGDGSFSADTRKRTAKHARHMLRLLRQGVELFTTGELTLRLEDPEKLRELGDRIADGDLTLARTEIHAAEAVFKQRRATSPLPDWPNKEAVGEWLYKVRLSQVPFVGPTA